MFAGFILASVLVCRVAASSLPKIFCICRTLFVVLVNIKMELVMLRRLFLCCFLLILSFPAIASDKKGIGLWDHGGAQRIRALNVAWYYNWGTSPSDGLADKEFVPMFSGKERSQSGDMNYLRSKGKIPLLLVFNEPDHADQANLSVEQVLALWPELSGVADAISTPAAAAPMGGWFNDFYRAARSKNLKMDFMAVHLYGPPDARKFLQRLDSIYSKYGLPIWITEFGVADWDAPKTNSSNRYSQAQVLEFMRQVLPELERRPFVLRYAWFGAGKNASQKEQVRTSALFDEDGQLNELGRYYAGF